MAQLLAPITDPKSISVAALPAPSRSGLPSTRGRVTMLVDMRETFDSMFSAIRSARNRVLIAAWFLHLDTQINGGLDPPTLIDEIRQLTRRPPVEVRILLSFLAGQAFPGATSAQNIRASILAGLNKEQLRFIKVQIGFHPAKLVTARVGTYHEKLILVDGETAFCGGLEFNKEYAVAEKKKKHRHDVHCRVEGPAVSMLERHFVALWNLASADAKAEKLNEDLLDPFPVTADANKTDQAMQWVFTASKEPFSKDVTEVFDSYGTAIDTAQSYIYIENQYFRSDDLTRRLINRLKSNPQLELIVLMPNAPEEDKDDPSTQFARWLSNEQLKVFKNEPPNKPRAGFFALCQGRDQFPYVHSKIMIVDDKWVTVGSANANARSFFLDMEANLIVRDDNTARDLRTRLWKEHFGSLNSQWTPGGGSAIDLWLNAAAKNADAISHGKRCPCFIIGHQYDPKIRRPTDDQLRRKFNIPSWLPISTERVKELVFEPEFDETPMA